jgi:hypothetical protein
MHPPPATILAVGQTPIEEVGVVGLTAVVGFAPVGLPLVGLTGDTGVGWRVVKTIGEPGAARLADGQGGPGLVELLHRNIR